jgi:hypothetical protein
MPPLPNGRSSVVSRSSLQSLRTSRSATAGTGNAEDLDLYQKTANSLRRLLEAGGSCPAALASVPAREALCGSKPRRGGRRSPTTGSAAPLVHAEIEPAAQRRYGCAADRVSRWKRRGHGPTFRDVGRADGSGRLFRHQTSSCRGGGVVGYCAGRSDLDLAGVLLQAAKPDK